MPEQSLAGIHFMLPTPYQANGQVDLDAFQRLVGKAREVGCRGVVCLGVMGEAHRLSDDERDAVMAAVIAQAGKDVAVTVGVSSEANHLAALRAEEAQKAGATAVMVAPPRMAKPNDQVLFGYYEAVSRAITVPMVVQDLPQETGVHMSPEFIARLNKEVPRAVYLKLEDSPTPPKVSRVLKATGPKMGVFGGLGGSFLYEELRRGAIGTMTGFAFPEVLVEIYRSNAKGDIERARATFYRWLPLIRYENQPGIGLSIRKHIMKRRGLINDAAVRLPGPSIDDATRAELEDLLDAMAV
ncbi:MAG: dihydrodipicolinate synthase family protein [SAR202 cluster bacterium]|nr:dihydrodipicolinate synthase family protein [SAR202 cluster bacterium]